MDPRQDLGGSLSRSLSLEAMAEALSLQPCVSRPGIGAHGGPGWIDDTLDEPPELFLVYVIDPGEPKRSQSECLAQMIPLGERHLRRAVKEYTEHYHLERNHQGLNNALIIKLADSPDMNAVVERRKRLGGVLNYYYRRAA